MCGLVIEPSHIRNGDLMRGNIKGRYTDFQIVRQERNVERNDDVEMK